MGLSTPTLVAIVSWYMSNVLMLLLNKMVLSTYNFKYPIFLVFCHMVCNTVLSFLVSRCSFAVHHPIKSKKQLWKVTVLAAVFSLSVVCGTSSLGYIPVSLNQMVGATTPFFTVIFAYIMLKKQESRSTLLALIPVVLGSIISSGYEPSFQLLGFLLCLTSTASRALKSVIQAVLLVDPDEKINSTSLLYYMCSIASFMLLPLWLVMEDRPYIKAYQLATTDQGFCVALLVNILIAYFINLTNFLVTQYTSALTLQVLGNAKGVVVVIVSVMVFHNPVSTISMIGFAITVVGTFLYSEAKRRKVMADLKAELAKALLKDMKDIESVGDSKLGFDINPAGLQEIKKLVPNGDKSIEKHA